MTWTADLPELPVERRVVVTVGRSRRGRDMDRVRATQKRRNAKERERRPKDRAAQ